MRLRCWAEHVSDGTLCERMSEPDMSHIHIGAAPGRERPCDVTWIDEYCAAESGPHGRKTAALRILEVSHEIDRLDFALGHPPNDEVRTIAARLYHHQLGSASDLRQLEWLRANTAAPEHRALLTLAADILKPFAGET